MIRIRSDERSRKKNTGEVVKISIMVDSLLVGGSTHILSPIACRLELELREFQTEFKSLDVAVCVASNPHRLTQEEKTNFGRQPRCMFRQSAKALRLSYCSQVVNSDQAERASFQLNATNNAIAELRQNLERYASKFHGIQEPDGAALFEKLIQVLTFEFRDLRHIELVEEECSRTCAVIEPADLENCKMVFLRDMQVYAEDDVDVQGTFNGETCCVTELYLKHLYRQVKIPEPGKINLGLTDRASDPEKYIPGMRCYSWPFDFAAYNNANDAHKKRMVLDAIHAAVTWMAKNEGWEQEPFQQAYDKSIADNLEFTATTKKSWPSPCGKFRARIIVKYELRDVEYWAVLFRNRSKTEIGREQLGTVRSGRHVVFEKLREATWRGETKFSLTTFFARTWCVDFAPKMQEAANSR